MRNEKIWTKSFTLVTVVNFLIMLSMFQLVVTFANYAIEKYGTSSSIAGLVASIFIVGILIGRLITGIFIENIGDKKLLLMGTIFFNIVVCFYFVQSSLFSLILIRIIHGVGVGIATASAVNLASKIIPSHRKGEGISYFSLSVILAGALGPLFGMILLTYWQYSSLFVFSLVISLLSLWLTLFVDQPIQNTMMQETKIKKAIRISNLVDRSALPISFVMFIMALAYSTVYAYVDVYTIEINQRWAGSIYFLIYSITVIISRPITGRLLDIKTANFVVYPTLISFAIGMLLFSQAKTGVLLLLAAIFNGYGYGNFQSIAQTLAVRNVPIDRLGIANTTYFISMDLATGLGPFFLGYLIPFIGYNGLFFTMFIFILIGTLFYYLLIGRKDSITLINERNMREREIK